MACQRGGTVSNATLLCVENVRVQLSVVIGVGTQFYRHCTVRHIAKDIQDQVRRKADHLKNASIPEAQRSLSAVLTVSSELSSRAKSIRT